MAKMSGPMLTIGDKDYDVNSDFTWRELLTVEELAGVPLGQESAFLSMGVMSAFVFVLMKRDDKALTWESFLNGSIADIEPEPAAKKPAAKRPPTKPSAS